MDVALFCLVECCHLAGEGVLSRILPCPYLYMQVVSCWPMCTSFELGVETPSPELCVHILVCGCGVRILWFTACYSFSVSIVCVCVRVCVCVCVCVKKLAVCTSHCTKIAWDGIMSMEGERAHSRLSSSCALSPSSLISCCTHAHT